MGSGCERLGCGDFFLFPARKAYAKTQASSAFLLQFTNLAQNMRATVTASRAATRSVRSVCTVAARASHHPISQHPLRKDVAGVLHGRPFPRLDALPCAVTAITTPPPSPEEERVEVLALRQAHLRERKVVVARAVHRGAVRGVVRDRDALADHAPAWRAQHRQLPTRRSARRLDRAGQLFGPAGDLSTVKPVH